MYVSSVNPNHLFRQQNGLRDFPRGGKSLFFSQAIKLLFFKPFALWEKRTFRGKGKLANFPLEGKFCLPLMFREICREHSHGSLRGDPVERLMGISLDIFFDTVHTHVLFGEHFREQKGVQWGYGMAGGME